MGGALLCERPSACGDGLVVFRGRLNALLAEPERWKWLLPPVVPPPDFPWWTAGGLGIHTAGRASGLELESRVRFAAKLLLGSVTVLPRLADRTAFHKGADTTSGEMHFAVRSAWRGGIRSTGTASRA